MLIVATRGRGHETLRGRGKSAAQQIKGCGQRTVLPDGKNKAGLLNMWEGQRVEREGQCERKGERSPDPRKRHQVSRR